VGFVNFNTLGCISWLKSHNKTGWTCRRLISSATNWLEGGRYLANFSRSGLGYRGRSSGTQHEVMMSFYFKNRTQPTYLWGKVLMSISCQIILSLLNLKMDEKGAKPGTNAIEHRRQHAFFHLLWSIHLHSHSPIKTLVQKPRTLFAPKHFEFPSFLGTLRL
jgi:hypothetical protein